MFQSFMGVSVIHDMFCIASLSNQVISNQVISNWDTSSVTNMINIFLGISHFATNVGSRNTPIVENICVCSRTKSSNSDIGKRNTSSVTSMSEMFHFVDMNLIFCGIAYSLLANTANAGRLFHTPAELGYWASGPIHLALFFFRCRCFRVF